MKKFNLLSLSLFCTLLSLAASYQATIPEEFNIKGVYNFIPQKSISQEKIVTSVKEDIKANINDVIDVSLEGINEPEPIVQKDIPSTNEFLLNEINTKNLAQSYPWLSDDGLKVYYTHGDDMYMASRSGLSDKFLNPHSVFSGIKETVISGWLSADELTIYFANQSNKLFKASRKVKEDYFETYKQVTLINAPDGSLFDVSFTPDMQELLMYNNDAKEQIVRFMKTGENEYTFKEIVNVLSGNIPTGGQLSRDGLRFYVPMKQTVNGNPDYRNLYVLTRTEMHAEFIRIEPLKATHEINFTAYQPCVNADETRCVFVTGFDNLWDNNDLCEVELVKEVTVTKALTDDKPHEIIKTANPSIIIGNPKVETKTTPTQDNITSTNVFENPVGMKLEVSISPNPFSYQTRIEVLSPVAGNLKIEVYSMSGQLVSTIYDGQTDKGLHIFTWIKNILNNGVYIVKTVIEKNVVTKKVVICDVGPL